MTSAEVKEAAAREGIAAPRERVNVLGVGVDPVNPARAVEIIERWIAGRDRQYVCVSGIHGVMESQRDESLRAIHNRAGLVVPDGMPLVWLSRLHGFRQADRVYGPDLLLECCGRSIRTRCRRCRRRREIFSPRRSRRHQQQQHHPRPARRLLMRRRRLVRGEATSASSRRT